MGKSGLRLSSLGLGGWTTFGGTLTDPSAADAVVRRAYDAGINFFDIADVYASGEAERLMGQALKRLPRSRLVISSKVFWPMSDDVNDRGLSRKHIMHSVEASLQRIGTDYLDLYFCHRFDPETPLEETVRAMDDLVHQGKVLYWGTSEWTPAQLLEAHELCRGLNLYAPKVEQPQYSLIEREKFERFVEPTASGLGMGLVVWSPLASGVLSGKYDDGIPEGSRLARMGWLREAVGTDENLARARALGTIADAVGCTRSQLAIAWVLAQRGVSSVILGANRLEQLDENLGALEVSLDEDMLEAVGALFGPRS